MALLDLCHEVLHAVLEQVQPEDLGRLSRCCKTLDSFIRCNRLLWRELYLKNFVSRLIVDAHYQSVYTNEVWQDDPPRLPTDAEPDWEDELHKAITLKKIFQSTNVEDKVLLKCK